VEIISWNFLLFFSVVLVVYYFLSRKEQNYWLFLASIFFFYTWGWPNLIPIFLIAGLSFVVGKKLKDANGRTWLVVGISIDIAAFILYRILNSPQFNIINPDVLAASPNFIKQFLIPLGFSFYVLQQFHICLIFTVQRSNPRRMQLIFFFIYPSSQKSWLGRLREQAAFCPS